MKPRIQHCAAKKLVGKRVKMSLVRNHTASLWAGFMPLRKDILNRVSEELYSVQLYDPDYFKSFSPATEFEKWAAVEVSDFDSLPPGMEKFSLPEGLYAVFLYKGLAGDPAIFQYIFTQWLPQSEYVLDDRPHFEVLGKKYRNDDLESEEEVWIPLKPREV